MEFFGNLDLIPNELDTLVSQKRTTELFISDYQKPQNCIFVNIEL